MSENDFKRIPKCPICNNDMQFVKRVSQFVKILNIEYFARQFICNRNFHKVILTCA